jgi:hypothetical protein
MVDKIRGNASDFFYNISSIKKKLYERDCVIMKEMKKYYDCSLIIMFE